MKDGVGFHGSTLVEGTSEGTNRRDKAWRLEGQRPHQGMEHACVRTRMCARTHTQRLREALTAGQANKEHREFSWGRVAVWPLLHLELPHLWGQSLTFVFKGTSRDSTWLPQAAQASSCCISAWKHGQGDPASFRAYRGLGWLIGTGPRTVGEVALGGKIACLPPVTGRTLSFFVFLMIGHLGFQHPATRRALPSKAVTHKLRACALSQLSPSRFICRRWLIP